MRNDTTNLAAALAEAMDAASTITCPERCVWPACASGTARGRDQQILDAIIVFRPAWELTEAITSEAAVALVALANLRRRSASQPRYGACSGRLVGCYGAPPRAHRLSLVVVYEPPHTGLVTVGAHQAVCELEAVIEAIVRGPAERGGEGRAPGVEHRRHERRLLL